MSSIFEKVIAYKGDLIVKLESMGLVPLFEPLASYLINKMEFEAVIMYIVMLYSKDSDRLLPIDYELIKQNIAGELMIEEPLRSQLITLDVTSATDAIQLSFITELIKVINAYLEIQSSATFSHIVMLKELYQTMKRGTQTIVTDGVVDYDQMAKNAKYAAELAKEIKEWEYSLAQEERSLKNQKGEIAKKRTKALAQIRVEDFTKQ